MITDDAIHEALQGLENVRWRETAFADLQWYYAENRVYVLRCKHGDPNEHLCVIEAKSADEAISRAVFNLYKSDESKRVHRNCDRFDSVKQAKAAYRNEVRAVCMWDGAESECFERWLLAPINARRHDETKDQPAQSARAKIQMEVEN